MDSSKLAKLLNQNKEITRLSEGYFQELLDYKNSMRSSSPAQSHVQPNATRPQKSQPARQPSSKNESSSRIAESNQHSLDRIQRQLALDESERMALEHSEEYMKMRRIHNEYIVEMKKELISQVKKYIEQHEQQERRNRQMQQELESVRRLQEPPVQGSVKSFNSIASILKQQGMVEEHKWLLSLRNLQERGLRAEHIINKARNLGLQSYNNGGKYLQDLFGLIEIPATSQKYKLLIDAAEKMNRVIPMDQEIINLREQTSTLQNKLKNFEDQSQKFKKQTGLSYPEALELIRNSKNQEIALEERVKEYFNKIRPDIGSGIDLQILKLVKGIAHDQDQVTLTRELQTIFTKRFTEDHSKEESERAMNEIEQKCSGIVKLAIEAVRKIERIIVEKVFMNEWKEPEAISFSLKKDDAVSKIGETLKKQIDRLSQRVSEISVYNQEPYFACQYNPEYQH